MSGGSITFNFNQIDEREIEVSCNGQPVVTLNYDDDGQGGMERIEAVIRKIAKIIGAEVS